MGNTLDADLVLLNGRVLSGTGGRDVSDAIAVKNGFIVAVGKSEELGKIQSKQKISIDGKIIVPGFIDAHNHFMLYCIALRHVDCRMPLDGDLHDVLSKIRDKVNEVGPGVWVKGWGYADYKIRQRRFPTLKELDEIAPDNPIAILHASWHSAAANSLALKQLGITAQTANPTGGRIEKDPATGKPNGVLHENAMHSVSFESMIEEFIHLPMKIQLAAISTGALEFSTYGITTTCDALCAPKLLSIYQAAEQQNVLKCRIVAMPDYEQSRPILESGLRSGFGSGMLKLGPVKLMGDGSLSGRTAAVTEPYQNTNDLGILYRDHEALDRIVQELDSGGFQMAIHAIGDRAVEQVLRAYEKVIGKRNPNNKRHRIEHAGILTPALIDAIADMDVVIATQPPMLYEQGDGFYRSCGRERMEWVYPYKALIGKGIHVAGSSDCPVVSPDPIRGMRDAILRRTEEGRVLAPAQRLSPEQALRMYTHEAAFSVFEEKVKGTIEEGKFADMVVLSGDPLTTSAEKWPSEVKVEMTIVGGEVVYSGNRT